MLFSSHSIGSEEVYINSKFILIVIVKVKTLSMLHTYSTINFGQGKFTMSWTIVIFLSSPKLHFFHIVELSFNIISPLKLLYTCYYS